MPELRVTARGFLPRTGHNGRSDRELVRAAHNPGSPDKRCSNHDVRRDRKSCIDKPSERAGEMLVVEIDPLGDRKSPSYCSDAERDSQTEQWRAQQLARPPQRAGGWARRGFSCHCSPLFGAESVAPTAERSAKASISGKNGTGMSHQAASPRSRSSAPRAPGRRSPARAGSHPHRRRHGALSSVH